MSYRLVTSRHNYRDLASGHVFHSLPGFPAFPVRLAHEMFLRAASHLPAERPLIVWDPCCGSGYLASVVGVLNRARVEKLVCSDIDPDAVALAARNLALLTEHRLRQRRAELLARAAEYGRSGYTEAAEATNRLALMIREGGGDLPAVSFVADAFDHGQLAATRPAPPPDLVLTDVPYGNQTTWKGSMPDGCEPTTALVRSLCQVLPQHAVIALSVQARRVSLGGGGIRALERFRLGKRAGFIGRVAELRNSL